MPIILTLCEVEARGSQAQAQSKQLSELLPQNEKQAADTGQCKGPAFNAQYPQNKTRHTFLRFLVLLLHMDVFSEEFPSDLHFSLLRVADTDISVTGGLSTGASFPKGLLYQHISDTQARPPEHRSSGIKSCSLQISRSTFTFSPATSNKLRL